MDLPDFDPMKREHKAWLDVVAEWNNVLPNTMNDRAYEPLISAINRWGETLVQLRMTQPQAVIDDGLQMTEADYASKRTTKGDQ